MVEGCAEGKSRGLGGPLFGSCPRASITSISPDAVSRRVTDVAAFQNGLWINWNRWADRDALERGLRLCEAIAFGEFG